MPAWLLSLIVKLAVQFGVPWIIAKVPWLAKFLTADLIAMIEKYIAEMNGEKVVIQNAKVRMAAKKRDAKKCVGSLCATDTKGLG